MEKLENYYKNGLTDAGMTMFVDELGSMFLKREGTSKDASSSGNWQSLWIHNLLVENMMEFLGVLAGLEIVLEL